jgi:hypothetical protein
LVIPAGPADAGPLNLHIWSVEQLAHECGRFHDYPFHLEGQSVDGAQRIWTGSFIRGTSDPARVTSRGSWVVRVAEFPLIASQITIHDVSEAEIQDRSLVGSYTLRRVHPTASGCRFEFHQDCDIYIEVDGAFRAELQDVGELRDVRGRIISVGFVDFGVRILEA